jgi:hypothetical protein
MRDVTELLERRRTLLDRRQEAKPDRLAEIDKELREIDQALSRPSRVNRFYFPSARRLSMASLRDSDRPTFIYHLKVHFFRTLTVILAWILIVAAFYQKPELLTGAQRLLQRGFEAIGDAIPPPWGPRIEFVFREIGGLIWLQITLFVLVLRLVLSAFAAIWRFSLRRDRGS